jgi:hypothetical protein
MKTMTNPIRGATVLAVAGLAFASAAEAVDLRDWGRKYNDASERFVVLSSFNNEAVLDKETQLVWRRSAPSATSWFYALQNCYASGTGGRYGWRLPSISELLSLAGTGGVLPVDHPFLNVSAQAFFWSSTDLYSNPAYARTKQLLANLMSATSKDTVNPYLCVRGVGGQDR